MTGKYFTVSGVFINSRYSQGTYYTKAVGSRKYEEVSANILAGYRFFISFMYIELPTLAKTNKSYNIHKY